MIASSSMGSGADKIPNGARGTVVGFRGRHEMREEDMHVKSKDACERHYNCR